MLDRRAFLAFLTSLPLLPRALRALPAPAAPQVLNPQAAKLLSATFATSSPVTVTWPQAANVSHYEIWRSSPDGPRTLLALVRRDAKHFVDTVVDTGLEPGVDYRYSMRSVDMYGNLGDHEDAAPKA